jgi:hypothetical protein
MSKQRESRLSHEIVAALNQRRHVVWKNVANEYSLIGLCDISGARKDDAILIALETKQLPAEMQGEFRVKAAIKKTSEPQRRFLRKVRLNCGQCRAGIVTSVREAIVIVEDIRSDPFYDVYANVILPWIDEVQL